MMKKLALACLALVVTLFAGCAVYVPDGGGGWGGPGNGFCPPGQAKKGNC